MHMLHPILKGCKKVLELSLTSLTQGMNFQGFEMELWKILHQLGKDILSTVPAAKDQELKED